MSETPENLDESPRTFHGLGLLVGAVIGYGTATALAFSLGVVLVVLAAYGFRS